MANKEFQAKSAKEPVIVVDHLTSGYGEHIVLKDVNLKVFPGEILVVIGESGCG